MIPVMANPRKRRRGRARSRRRVRPSTRRKLRLSARRRAAKSSFKAGFAGGMRQCGRLVARAAHRRKASGGTTGFAIPKWSANPRRHRNRYRRNAWVPSYSFNPVGNVTSGVKKAFSFGELKGAVPYVVGAFANGFVTRALTGLPFVPAGLQSGYGYAGLQAVSAGIASAVAQKFAPGWSNGVLVGGVVAALNTAVGQAGYSLGLKDYANLNQPVQNAPTRAPYLGSIGCDSFAMAGMGHGGFAHNETWGADNLSGEF